MSNELDDVATAMLVSTADVELWGGFPVAQFRWLACDAWLVNC